MISQTKNDEISLKDPQTQGNKSVSTKKPAVYMCKPCDVVVSDYHSLERHFNEVHRPNVEITKSEQRRPKNIIEKLQERAKGYSRSKNGKYTCNYCDYQTVLINSVTAHVSKLHKNHGQTIAVRTSSITLAIEPLVKEELDMKPDVCEEQGTTDEVIPIDNDMTEDLIEGDTEMVQEVNELLANNGANSDLIDEDDDYIVDQYNEADDPIAPPDESVYDADEIDFDNQTEEYGIDDDRTDEYIEDYNGEAEYIDDSVEYDIPCNEIQVETQIVEDNDMYMLEKEPQNSQVVTYTCPYCDYAITDKATIHKHITSTHKEVLAGRIHDRMKNLDQKRARKFSSYDCPKCDFVGRTRTILYEHARENHPGKIQPAKFRKQPPEDLKCDRCDFITPDRRKMMMHIDRKHTTEFRFTCEFCGKKFKVKCDLTSHIRFQHFTVPLVCDVCGKVCNNSNSLHVHQKREHFKPEFECNICHRRMVTQENLDEHILRQHEQRTRFMCEQCGKVFDQASKLKQHSMTHTGERPHTCHLCGKAFARRAVFRQHLLIHTGEKPYVCDICGKSFTQKPGLICHRKMHPGDKPPLPVVYIDHILKKIEKKVDKS